MNGKRYYLDANTVIAILEHERPFTSEQEAFVRGIDEGAVSCCSSELALAECLVRPMREGKSENIDAILAFLDDRENLPLIKADRATFIRAAQVRAEINLKLPDAMHVALAESNKCTIFLSADRKLRLPSSLRRMEFDEL